MYRSMILTGIFVLGSLYADEIEELDLDVIAYEALMEGDDQTIALLERALHEKGIVAVKGVPGYREKVEKFIEAARNFSSLDEEVKETYAPNRALGDLFMGYEKGKEKFRRPDGRWVVDDLKVSYYGFVPERPSNRWPVETDLGTPFEELGAVMVEVGTVVMEKIGLLGPQVGFSIEGVPHVGRMLHYRKSTESQGDNPFWCGSHFDHGLFTALIPASYFEDGQPVPEPIEAGLFVKTTAEGVFKKVVANDPELLLFQVAEFGQLLSDDAIRATEHRVQKASGSIERYTMALFFEPPMQTVVHSLSALTQDARYGAAAGEACSYRHWTEESFKRYLVTE